MNFDLKAMFYERGEDSTCYKKNSRLDMGFDREQAMHELIMKKALESTSSDT